MTASSAPSCRFHPNGQNEQASGIEVHEVMQLLTVQSFIGKRGKNNTLFLACTCIETGGETGPLFAIRYVPVFLFHFLATRGSSDI